MNRLQMMLVVTCLCEVKGREKKMPEKGEVFC